MEAGWQRFVISCEITFLRHISPDSIILIDKDVFIHLSILCRKDVWSLLQWTLHIGKEKHNGLICSKLNEKSTSLHFHNLVSLCYFDNKRSLLSAVCSFIISTSPNLYYIIHTRYTKEWDRVCNFWKYFI